MPSKSIEVVVSIVDVPGRTVSIAKFGADGTVRLSANGGAVNPDPSLVDNCPELS